MLAILINNPFVVAPMFWGVVVGRMRIFAKE